MPPAQRTIFPPSPLPCESQPTSPTWRPPFTTSHLLRTEQVLLRSNSSRLNLTPLHVLCVLGALCVRFFSSCSCCNVHLLHLTIRMSRHPSRWRRYRTPTPQSRLHSLCFSAQRRIRRHQHLHRHFLRRRASPRRRPKNPRPKPRCQNPRHRLLCSARPGRTRCPPWRLFCRRQFPQTSNPQFHRC